MLKNIADVFLGLFDTSWNEVWTSIKDFFIGIWDSICSAFQAVADFFTNIWNAISSEVSSVVNAIRNTVSSVWNSISSTISSVMNTIRSYLHFSVPDVGPLTDFESWMPDFMNGLADGINKSKKVVAKAVSGVADTMKISMNSDLDYNLDGMTSAIINGSSESSVVNNYYNNDNSRTVNQTNNSAKSLSRLEIYRMTRNAVNV